MTKKKAEDKYFHKMACTGCGRHARLVDNNVNAWFCTNCFNYNGNYLRYRGGYPLIKPLADIRVNDILRGADGKYYKVVSKAKMPGEDKYFYCRPYVFGVSARKQSKEEFMLGDFFFTGKAGEDDATVSEE